MHTFDYLAPLVAAQRDRQVVALDLRGRGGSDVTPPGTYGLAAHARDVLEAATLLGAERFDWVGWSLGALTGIVASGIEPGRISSLGVIDHGGTAEEGALAAVRAGLDRLDLGAQDAAAYVETIASMSPIRPFTDFWRRCYAYEFGRTSKSACLEDLAETIGYDWPARWSDMTMPVALVRCVRPLNGGLVVPEAVATRMAAAVPTLVRTDVDADHFTVMTHPAAAKALGALIDRAV
jgi:pimeloyl-ACP methyl ester carboxylesterase